MCVNNNCGGCNSCQPTICNQCPPTECECAVRISTDCVTYTGDDLACSSIPKNTILTDVIIQLDAFICQAIADLNAAINLINIGAGAEVYKGIDGIGRRELRKINAVGDLITVTQNTNDISVSIDEDALGDFIEGNQKTYSIDNIGTGVEIYKTPDDVVANNTEFNLRTLNTNSLQITTVGDEIFIDELPIFQGTDYYVNGNYTGLEEKGTPSKPFKTLPRCVDKILNRGIENDPLINGGNVYEKWDLRNENQRIRVVIQSYSETSENLAINGVTYFLERGGFDSMIQLVIGSTSDYIIDMKELVDNVPKVVGALPYNLICAIIGKGTVAIQEGHTTRKGYFSQKL